MKMKNWVISLFLLAACNNSDRQPEQKTATAQKDTVVHLENDTSFSRIDSTPAPAPAQASPAIPLALNLQKGKTYSFNINTLISGTNQKGQQRSTTVNWYYDIQPQQVKNGIRSLRATYKKLAMAMDMGDQKMDFSSEREVEGFDLMQFPSRLFRAMKGQSFTINVDANGNIVSIEGMDRIMDSAISQMNLPEAMRPALTENMKKQISTESARQAFAPAFSFYPPRPVKEGDTWTRKSPGIISKDEVTTTYTVRQIRDGKVTIDAKATEAGQAARLIVDQASGLLLNGTFDQKAIKPGGLSGRMKITGSL